MKSITIYHNPRCSKSRQALQLLEERGYKPHIIEYLKTPLSKTEISQLLRVLHMKPRDVMRKGEDVYRTLGLGDEKITDEELIKHLISNPILLERPIVVMGEKAVIARPPERLLEILTT